MRIKGLTFVSEISIDSSRECARCTCQLNKRYSLLPTPSEILDRHCIGLFRGQIDGFSRTKPDKTPFHPEHGTKLSPLNSGYVSEDPGQLTAFPSKRITYVHGLVDIRMYLPGAYKVKERTTQK